MNLKIKEIIDDLSDGCTLQGDVIRHTAQYVGTIQGLRMCLELMNGNINQFEHLT